VKEPCLWHLPRPPRDPAAYRRLYEMTSPFDDIFYQHEPWQEIRIRPGSSALDVYHRLPSASDFEYGGYITETRIRYQGGGATSARTIRSKACIFHTHPSEYPTADMPSVCDVYQFLKCRHLRAITVGADWIWVWNKTLSVLRTVRRLFAWEAEHMVPEASRLMREAPADFRARYFALALDALGVKWPQSGCREPKVWCGILRDGLGITTTLIRGRIG
jgi:hypothetical protein